MCIPSFHNYIITQCLLVLLWIKLDLDGLVGDGVDLLPNGFLELVGWLRGPAFLDGAKIHDSALWRHADFASQFPHLCAISMIVASTSVVSNSFAHVAPYKFPG